LVFLPNSETRAKLIVAQAAVVTLYGVQQPTATQTTVSVEQLGITIASAIGPGESGRTRYEIQDIHSLIVYHDLQSSTALTGVDSPITATCKFSQLHIFSYIVVIIAIIRIGVRIGESPSSIGLTEGITQLKGPRCIVEEQTSRL